MQGLGINILFKGINFQRLLGGLWVTLRLALITIGLSCVFGFLFSLLTLSQNRWAKAVSRLWLEKQGIKYVFHQDIFRVSDEALCFRGDITLVCLVNGRLAGSPDYDAAFAPYL